MVGTNRVIVSLYCFPVLNGQLVVVTLQTLEGNWNGAGTQTLSSTAHIFCDRVE